MIRRTVRGNVPRRFSKMRKSRLCARTGGNRPHRVICGPKVAYLLHSIDFGGHQMRGDTRVVKFQRLCQSVPAEPMRIGNLPSPPLAQSGAPWFPTIAGRALFVPWQSIERAIGLPVHGNACSVFAYSSRHGAQPQTGRAVLPDFARSSAAAAPWIRPLQDLRA